MSIVFVIGLVAALVMTPVASPSPVLVGETERFTSQLTAVTIEYQVPEVAFKTSYTSERSDQIEEFVFFHSANSNYEISFVMNDAVIKDYVADTEIFLDETFNDVVVIERSIGEHDAWLFAIAEHPEEGPIAIYLQYEEDAFRSFDLVVLQVSERDAFTVDMTSAQERILIGDAPYLDGVDVDVLDDMLQESSSEG